MVEIAWSCASTDAAPKTFADDGGANAVLKYR